MFIVTVIPARSGSKGIPMKNIKLLKGQPLLSYSVRYSLKCELVSNTIVSTDSNKIARIAIESGAEVPFLRPLELSQDHTQDYPVLKHALIEMEKIHNKKIDFLVLLRPTSPYRPEGLIEKGIEKLISHPGATSLRSVTLTKEHPYRQWISDGDFIIGYEKGVKESYNIPRQLIPKVYFQTGDIEIVRRATLIKGSVSGGKVLPLVLRHEDMLDIDTEKDWVKINRI